MEPTALTALLDELVERLKRGFNGSLVSPSKLKHTAEVMVRGRMAEVRSNVKLDDMTTASSLTVYLHIHAKSASAASDEDVESIGSSNQGSNEIVSYFHYNANEPLSTTIITVSEREGSLWQNIRIGSFPKELALVNLERIMGKKQPRRGLMLRGSKARGSKARGSKGRFGKPATDLSF